MSLQSVAKSSLGVGAYASIQSSAGQVAITHTLRNTSFLTAFTVGCRWDPELLLPVSNAVHFEGACVSPCCIDLFSIAWTGVEDDCYTVEVGGAAPTALLQAGFVVASFQVAVHTVLIPAIHIVLHACGGVCALKTVQAVGLLLLALSVIHACDTACSPANVPAGHVGVVSVGSG